jgi:ADP-ribose pyrophosphatase
MRGYISGEKMRFVEKPFKKKTIYSGNAVGFNADEVILPDGKKACREYMRHPGAVAAVAFTGKGDIVLVRQYRYPIGKLTYEIPAGKLDKGESPVSCVRRELAEETGFTAKKIRKLCAYWPTPAFSDEVIHIYLARGLKQAGMSPDSDEFIDCKIVPLKRALSWIKNGKIRDSKTIIAILYLMNFVRNTNSSGQ